MPELQPAQPGKGVELLPIPYFLPSFFPSINHQVYKTPPLISNQIPSLSPYPTSRGIDIKYGASAGPQTRRDDLCDASQSQKYKLQTTSAMLSVSTVCMHADIRVWPPKTLCTARGKCISAPIPHIKPLKSYWMTREYETAP